MPVAEVTLTQLPLGSRARLAFRISLRLARCALRKTDSPVPGIPLSRGLSAGGPLMRPGPGLLLDMNEPSGAPVLLRRLGRLKWSAWSKSVPHRPDFLRAPSGFTLTLLVLIPSYLIFMYFDKCSKYIFFFLTEWHINRKLNK